MFCEKCGEKIRKDGTFCEHCGNEVKIKKIFCENCGEEIKIKGDFCEKCGHENVITGKKKFFHSQNTVTPGKKKYFHPLFILLIVISFIPSMLLLIRDDKTPSWAYGNGWFVKRKNDMAFINVNDMKLYLIKPDGSKRRKIESDLYWADPLWSPSGNELVCLGSNDEFSQLCAWHKEEIFICNPDTEQFSSIGSGDLIHNLHWSPDGSKIAFNQAGNKINLWVIDMEKSGQRNILEGIENSFVDGEDRVYIKSLCWMPDSRNLLIACNKKLWLIDTENLNISKYFEINTKKIEISPGGEWLTCITTINTDKAQQETLEIIPVVKNSRFALIEKPEVNEKFTTNIQDFVWNKETGEVFYLLTSQVQGDNVSYIPFSEIRSYSPKTGEKKTVFTLDQNFSNSLRIILSPDGQSLSIENYSYYREGGLKFSDLWVADIEKKVMKKIVDGGCNVDW